MQGYFIVFFNPACLGLDLVLVCAKVEQKTGTVETLLFHINAKRAQCTSFIRVSDLHSYLYSF